MTGNSRTVLLRNGPKDGESVHLPESHSGDIVCLWSPTPRFGQADLNATLESLPRQRIVYDAETGKYKGMFPE